MNTRIHKLLAGNTFALLLVILLAGCSASKSVVVLLPDEKGRVGQISVRTAQGDIQLHNAYQSADIGGLSPLQRPSDPMPPHELERTFTDALEAQPSATSQIDLFTIYYEKDSTTITTRSRQALDSLCRRLKRSGFRTLYVVGHTDREGSVGYNWILSRRRALSLKKILTASGLDGQRIVASWVGEGDPQVVTPDGIEEPLNRRVRIVVRREPRS